MYLIKNKFLIKNKRKFDFLRRPSYTLIGELVTSVTVKTSVLESTYEEKY